MRCGDWTPERLAMLRAEYPTCMDTAALARRINALPGRPLLGPSSLHMKALRIGVRKSPETDAAIRSANGRRGWQHGNIGSPRCRTPEREVMLREQYPAETQPRELLARLNQLPGHPIASIQAVRAWAKLLGVRKLPAARGEIARVAGRQGISAAHAWQAAQEPGKRSRGGPKPMPSAPPMRRERVVVKPPSVKPAAPAASPPVDPGISRYERARALIERGRDPFKVAADVGIERWRALGIAGEIRQARLAASPLGGEP